MPFRSLWAGIALAALAGVLCGLFVLRDRRTNAERAEVAPRPDPAAAPAAGSTASAGPLPLYELKIEPGELRQLERDPFSNKRHPATFVANGRQYSVEVRHRGAWARTWSKKPLKLFFAKGQEFEGNHCLNLNSAWRDPAFIREPLAYHVYAACGVPSPACRMVQLHINGRFGGLYVEAEQPDKPFLKRHHLQGAAVYKANSEANRADERDLGSEAAYPAHYEKETHKADGHRALQMFCHELAVATNTAEFFAERVEVDGYLSYLAVNALVQNWDCFNKNHFLLQDERGSGKWTVVPWDLDRTFGDHWHGSFEEARLTLLLGMRSWPGPTGWNRMADRFLGNPALRARFLDRLEQLLQHEFTKEKLFPFLDRLESQIAPAAAQDRKRWPGAPSDLHAGIAEVKSYIERRRAHLIREIARLRQSG